MSGSPGVRTAWARVAGWFLGGLAAGASLAYFFDPERGRRRRHLARDRAVGVSHRVTRRTGRTLRAVAAQAQGHARGLAHRLRPGPVAELDDIELAHKVESILFRDRRVPKGQISVNAEEGRVFLRGEVEPDLIADLEHAVRKIRGVRDVENLLHPPGTPAPAHAAGPRPSAEAAPR
jgi:hypothetical protein